MAFIETRAVFRLGGGRAIPLPQGWLCFHGVTPGDRLQLRDGPAGGANSDAMPQGSGEAHYYESPKVKNENPGLGCPCPAGQVVWDGQA